MQQILEIVGFLFLIGWFIAFLATQLWYLVEMVRANVGLAILSFFLPFVGLYMLVRYWQELKRPFCYQVSVGLGGIFVLMVFAVVFDGFLGESLAAEAAANEEDPEGEMWISPTTGSETVPAEAPMNEPVVPVVPAWGVEVPVGESAVVTVPRGWSRMQWSLPNLAAATGDTARGEYVTLHLVERIPDRSFEDFQAFALQQIRRDLIDGGEATAPHVQFVGGAKVSSSGLAGRNRLPDRIGEPMSARLSCVEGIQHRYYIVQWRTRAWDAQSRTHFDRLLKSFGENNVMAGDS